MTCVKMTQVNTVQLTVIRHNIITLSYVLEINLVFNLRLDYVPTRTQIL